MKKGEGIGFGKVILFNEHFVVYGIPAIVSAIGKYTVARVEATDKSGVKLEDNRKATPGYKEEKLEQQKDSLNRILKVMNIDTTKRGIKITLDGDLVAASGIGASAASCVAIARALSDYFNLGLSDEEINKVAYEGEKGYHGTPSGIDNTASTFGGLLWFEKDEPPVIEKISMPNPVEIIMGNTGKVADTAAAVAGVRERKEKYPDKYEKIFERAKNIAFLARRALQDEDYEEVGKLMNENHKLLQQIEVSSKELDFLVDVARENGALGAKLTGGGLGGNMIALTPGKELQEEVANAIEKEGFQVIKTVIGASRRGGMML
ncbi:mevalonate kinase [Euryarchaeota archaeon ex4484_162]|nr:MAG: mevalonate kinase [Euryarchaeota archaeon ex4484_162]